MHDTDCATTFTPVSEAGLAFACGLLTTPGAASPSLEELLAALARSFTAAAAGLHGPLASDHPILCRASVDGRSLLLSRDAWNPDLIESARGYPSAVVVGHPEFGRCLVALIEGPGGEEWLLWLEGAAAPNMTPDAGAALVLTGLAVVRCAAGHATHGPWARQLAAARRRQSLEQAAALARRLAHEFGNLLTGILGFCELALEQAHDESSQTRFLKETHRAAQQAADMIQLLRLFGSRRAITGCTAPLAEAVTLEASRLRTKLRAGVELALDVPADLPSVAISADLLAILLQQLLANACEALDGPGRLRVSARLADLTLADCTDLLGSAHPGRHVELQIADSGRGLDAAVRRQLFREPFFSAKPRHRGFGLAAVHGILRAHRGGFRLDSPPLPGDAIGAQGTIARVYLPLALSPAVAVSPPAVASSGNVSILVVDDEPSVRAMIGATLKSAGYRVAIAESALGALEAHRACREPFQLVLADVFMPEVNGFELAHQLRERDGALRFLFMSGRTPDELTRAHGQSGPYEFLAKPFRTGDLLRAVRTALNQKDATPDSGPGEEAVVPGPCPAADSGPSARNTSRTICEPRPTADTVRTCPITPS